MLQQRRPLHECSAFGRLRIHRRLSRCVLDGRPSPLPILDKHSTTTATALLSRIPPRRRPQWLSSWKMSGWPRPEKTQEVYTVSPAFTQSVNSRYWLTGYSEASRRSRLNPTRHLGLSSLDAHRRRICRELPLTREPSAARSQRTSCAERDSHLRAVIAALYMHGYRLASGT